MVIDVLRSTIDDLQLPIFVGIRIYLEIFDVVLIISDDRLVQILELLNSIPRPNLMKKLLIYLPQLLIKLRDRAKMVAIMEVSDELDEIFYKR
ncbi:hypothetical protein Mgra_00010043 [Meloidogyne graminicola]|uniref:Uncharacterized protein n=1 Tax=Meloidogyne graminicola TaxID=189291 RepID=A0A8S9Z699_9BILA|nr:hypothetical protein Mgra_00010043 [Meloidogyne graminicola]